MESQLIWSLKNGDLDQVKEIVETHNIDVNVPLEGRPAIHYASDYGQKEVIKYLISRGADVNATDKHGIPVVLAAIWEGHTDCVKLLIESGACKDGKTPDGKTFVEVAEKQDIVDILKS